MSGIKNPLGKSNPARAKLGEGPRGTQCQDCQHRIQVPGQGMGGKRSWCENPQGQVYVYRSWYSCAAYSGPSGEVEITCPECQEKRHVLKTSTRNANHKAICAHCSQWVLKHQKEILRGQKALRAVVKPLPVFEGCSPVRFKPATRNQWARCAKGDHCRGYLACLDYEISRNWPGFKEGRADA